MNDKSQDINRQLIEAVNAVQALADQAFEAAGNNLTEDGPLSQLGLRNGRDIVLEYLSFGEASERRMLFWPLEQEIYWFDAVIESGNGVSRIGTQITQRRQN